MSLNGLRVSSSAFSVLFLGLFCLLIGKSVSDVPMFPLVVVVSAFLFLFAFLFTEQAMILLIISMLLSPEFVLGASSNRQDIFVRADDLLIVVFVLAWLARTAIAKKHIIIKLPINRYILFYCFAFTFATAKGMIVGSVVPLKGIFYIFKYLEYYMFFYLAAGVIKSKKQLMTYLKVFILVFLIVNIFACTQISSGRVSAPFEGKFGEPNTLGGYQVLIFGVIIGLLTHAKAMRWRVPLTIITFFSMLPFAYTLSRASYMAFVPMYFTLIVFSKGKSRNALIAALVCAVIVSFFIFPPIVKERILYTFSPRDSDQTVTPVSIGSVTLDPSASARINDWVRLFEAWQGKPMMGYGLTGVGFVDSQYISVLVESGLLGFSAFLMVLFHISMQVWRIYRNTKDDVYAGLAIGFLAGHFGMIFHAFTANTYIIIRIMEPYWFLAGLVMMIPKLEKLAQTPEEPPAREERNNTYLTNTSFLIKDGKYSSS